MTPMPGEPGAVPPLRPTEGPTVIALIAAYNEEDIIGQVIRHLIDQDVGVYLLDHASTDGTVAAAEPYLRRGLLRIEHFTERNADGRVSWAAILRRKEELARELKADWFIHHDADEFRDSPWAHLKLRNAIGFVDRLGYNAVDFELFNFWPTRDGFSGHQDVREAFRHYTPGAACDRIQIKAWKNVPGPVDLMASGGHEAIFPGRRVFPIRFILRHYPIRSQSHGLRKVLHERKARFSEEEHRRGWHVQYDEMDESYDFIRDPSALTEYDPDEARLHVVLHHRGVELLEQTPTTRDETVSDLRRNVDVLSRQLDGCNRNIEELHQQLDQGKHDVEELQHRLERRNRDIEELHQRLDRGNREAEELHQQLDRGKRDIEELQHQLDRRNREAEDLHRELDRRNREAQQLASVVAATDQRLNELYASLSWRCTAPFRAIGRALNRRRGARGSGV